MSLFTSLRSPRRLTAIFIATILVPAAALGFLAWRTIEQERALERQRIRDRLDIVAAGVSLGLDSRLKETARQLVSAPSSPDLTKARDSLLVRIAEDRIRISPAGRLLYYPAGLPPDTVPPGVLEPAENLEFSVRDDAKAAGAYRRLVQAYNPAVRAAAWNGLARCLRRTGQSGEALAAYDQLAQLRTVFAGGIPAELLGRHAACRLLSERKAADLSPRAQALYRDLQQGRWQLDRATYQLYVGQVRAWLSGADMAEPTPEAFALADAVGEAADIRRRLGRQPGSGRTTAWLSGRSKTYCCHIVAAAGVFARHATRSAPCSLPSTSMKRFCATSRSASTSLPFRRCCACASSMTASFSAC